MYLTLLEKEISSKIDFEYHVENILNIPLMKYIH